MVYGAFGNPGGCSLGDKFFVKSDHAQYKALYAMAMTAFVAKQRLFAYVDSCQPVTWYTAPTTTFNTVSGGSVMHIH
jgi:hypothetical protein